ncbi:MAG: hypothetical protein AAGC55_06140, partial [Myxococcota bacterium]
MRLYAALAVLAAVAAAVGLWLWRAQTGPETAATPAASRADDDRPARPSQRSPRPVSDRAAPAPLAARRPPMNTDNVGARVCSECHPDEHQKWSSDWHAKALTRPTPATVVGDYDNAHFSGTSSEAWMKRDGERYIMRTRDRSGAMDDYTIECLIGGKRMQDPVAVMPDGRWQV